MKQYLNIWLYTAPGAEEGVIVTTAGDIINFVEDAINNYQATARKNGYEYLYTAVFDVDCCNAQKIYVNEIIENMEEEEGKIRNKTENWGSILKIGLAPGLHVIL